MTVKTTHLPHWDMSVVFPSLTSPEFAQAMSGLRHDIDALAELLATLGIDAGTTGQNADAAPAVERVIEQVNDLLASMQTISSYVEAFVTTDSRDDLAQAKMSEIQLLYVRVKQLLTRFTAWIGTLDLDAIIAASDVAKEHAFFLHQAKTEATHLMSPAEEDLAAELDLAAGAAWSKLHGNLTSQLMVAIELDGEAQELPMSVVRNLAYESDRTRRRAGYEAELRTWPTAALPLAGAINSIKSQSNTLTSRRGWDSALDAALFINHIDRQTLEAMLSAAREALPEFRRYLRAKAKLLGLPALAWYDLFAPVGVSGRVWEWDDAVAFITTQFGTYSDKLREFAERAFRERWIDAEPRPGKTDGGFCMPLRRDESRVLVNFTPSYGGVSTIAHELGHAYHNLDEAPRTMLQRDTPMTLAETASIFCETIIREAALRGAGPAERLHILEASLQDSTQTVVDIFSRFLFEQRLHERRHERELSVDELNQLMLDAQREIYGDGLDQSALHPYMWAVKSHYYWADLSFYNFPYMFGLLFGLGLYARYREDPDGFTASYDELLSSTGMADAATLAARFGIDITTPDFWRSSFDILRKDIDRFVELSGQIS